MERDRDRERDIYREIEREGERETERQSKGISIAAIRDMMTISTHDLIAS